MKWEIKVHSPEIHMSLMDCKWEGVDAIVNVVVVAVVGVDI